MPTPSPISLQIDSPLLETVCLGLVRAEPVRVGPSSAPQQSEMEELAAELATEHASKAPSAIEGLRPARQLYRSFGIDPTRTRPSSEALLRRILRGKPLPAISNAVDLCNLLALRFLLPLGLYDTAAIHGPVALRAGGPGESFAGIRKDEVHVEGRPVLADGTGPFGNPTSDSLRTSVGPGTGSLWMVIFAPAGYPAARLEAHVAESCSAMARHLAPSGGKVETCGEVMGKG